MAKTESGIFCDWLFDDGGGEDSFLESALGFASADAALLVLPVTSSAVPSITTESSEGAVDCDFDFALAFLDVGFTAMVLNSDQYQKRL